MISKIRFKIITKDRGINEALRRVAGIDNMAGRVGVVGEKAAAVHPLRKNITVGEVAIINEYGSSRAGVPRRPAVKDTMEASHDAVVNELAHIARDIVELRQHPHPALMELGRKLAQRLQSTIKGGVEPENAPSTIREKGHGNTLIHTETLLNAVGHDVVAKREGELVVESPPVTESGE